MEVEGVVVVTPCKLCKDRKLSCTVFLDESKGNVCAYCKRHGKPCTAGESRPDITDTTPLVVTQEVLHQIGVTSGAAIASASDARQLVGSIKDKEEEQDNKIAMLEQEVGELKEEVRVLKDTVAGQQRQVDELIKRMDNTSATNFRSY
jgi:Fe-S-cluster containining protein